MAPLTNTPELAPTPELLASIDLDQRPAAYFGTSEELLANIFGDERREAVRAQLAAGRGTDVPEPNFASELDEDLRQFAGQLNPTWMGGEYLPPLLEGEVEIARVRLDSTTADVISVRARPDVAGIRYRVVDEYMEDHDFRLARETSDGPLSLAELVALIDSADNGSGHGAERGAHGLVVPHWLGEWDLHGELERVRSFTRVRSEFYPRLEVYYDLVCEAWCHEQRLAEVAEGLQEALDGAPGPGSGSGHDRAPGDC
ncbi:MAG: hypothetical protein P1V81_15725 [Planctomycetota bacterium]|nr:hypothetical protein [Planctomycetota bacterium]